MQADDIKEEIKAAYGYEKVYSVPAVSRINALDCRNERQERQSLDRKAGPVSFEDVLQKTVAGSRQETVCTMQGYGKTGAYEEYLYLKREYRQ